MGKGSSSLEIAHLPVNHDCERKNPLCLPPQAEEHVCCHHPNYFEPMIGGLAFIVVYNWTILSPAKKSLVQLTQCYFLSVSNSIPSLPNQIPSAISFSWGLVLVMLEEITPYVFKWVYSPWTFISKRNRERMLIHHIPVRNEHGSRFSGGPCRVPQDTAAFKTTKNQPLCYSLRSNE